MNFTLGQSSNAAGTTTARKITHNSLYSCNGKSFEIVGHVSNPHSLYTTLNVICLTSNDRARWVLISESSCKFKQDGSYKCRGNDASYIQLKSYRLANQYLLKRAVLGEFCDLKKIINIHSNEESIWDCQKVTNLNKLSLITKGNTDLTLITEEFIKYMNVGILGVEERRYIVNTEE
jgi:hypothetical protein